MYEEIPSVQLKWTSPPGSRVLLFSLLHNFRQLSFTSNGFSGIRGQMDYKVTSKVNHYRLLLASLHRPWNTNR